MTPSPDTGAGTPLTPYDEDDPGLRNVWLEGYEAGARSRPATDPAGTPLTARLSEALRRTHPRLLAETLATLAARPATDPAGLDDVRRETYDTVLRGLRSEDDSVQLRAIIASVEAARARLSVADGPGPEERV